MGDRLAAPRTPGDHHDRDNRKTVRIDAGRPGAADDLGNRETVHLPLQRRPPQTRRAPLVVAAAFATLWAALLSYLPVAVVMGLARSMEGSGGILGSARVGLAAWLLGHGVPLGTSIGPISLAPLLLTLLAGWRLTRAACTSPGPSAPATAARPDRRCSSRPPSGSGTAPSAPSPRSPSSHPP